MITISYLITAFIIILLPGTGVLYTVSTGFLLGRSKSIYAALGCTLGILPHLIISIFFSSCLLATNQFFFSILRYAGVIYLIYLGFHMLCAEICLHTENKKEEYAFTHILLRGIFINLLNPKLTLFFFAFLPQYIHTQSSYTRECCILGIIFMLLTFFVFCGYGFLSGNLLKNTDSSSILIRLLPKIFGIVFILFAIRLMW